MKNRTPIRNFFSRKRSYLIHYNAITLKESSKKKDVAKLGSDDYDKVLYIACIKIPKWMIRKHLGPNLIMNINQTLAQIATTATKDVRKYLPQEIELLQLQRF